MRGFGSTVSSSPCCVTDMSSLGGIEEHFYVVVFAPRASVLWIVGGVIVQPGTGKQWMVVKHWDLPFND